MRWDVASARRFTKRNAVHLQRTTAKFFAGAVRLKHFGVLDGRNITMIGHVDDPIFGGRVELDLVLTLKARGIQHRRRLVLDTPAGDGTVFNMCLPIGNAPEALPLTVGRWAVAFCRPQTERRVAAVVDAQAIPKQAGPTTANPRSPETGLQYAPKLTDVGELFVIVKSFPPHAELERLWTRGPTVFIEGRIIRPADSGLGTDFPDAEGLGLIQLQPEDGGRAIDLGKVDVQNSRFALQIELDEPPFDALPQKWLASIVAKNGVRLPVARLLDDAKHVAKVIKYPPVVLAVQSTSLHVRPGFDRQNRFVLDVRSPSVERGDPR